MKRALAILLLGITTGCGSGSGPLTPANGGTSVPPPSNGSGSAVGTPVTITVSGGLISAGVNIVVPPPASATRPNAESLGATDPGAAGSASNTGTSVQRGRSYRVILFGNGLNGNMQVTLGGPDDIAVSNAVSIESTDGKPGISFDANVSSGAALGARSVYLKAVNNDITVFTGGLEVTP